MERRESETKKPKSFLIESNCKINEIRGNGEIEFKPSDDPTLLNVLVYQKVSPLIFYLDINDPRFWIIHTTEYSGVMSKVIRQLVLANNSKLDFPWLSSDSLQVVRSLGKDTGFRLWFEQQLKAEDEATKLKVMFWGKNVPEFLDGLKKIREDAISLSSVGLDFVQKTGLFVKT